MDDRPKFKVEDGIEFKLCHKCGDYWIHSDEFFTRNIDGHLVSPCRACWEEKRIQTNLEKPCCYPNCNEPRASKYQSRCHKHAYQVLRKVQTNDIQHIKR